MSAPTPSDLDANQCIQGSYDDANGRLRVDATVTTTVADVIISAEESNIAIKDPISGHILTINPDGSVNVDVILNATSDSVKSWTQDGTGNPISSTAGALNVNASNPSIGTNASIAPSSSTQMGATDSSGKLQPLMVDPSGKLLVDITGSSTVTGTINSNLLGLNSFQTSQYTIGTSAVQLTPSPLTNRSSMSIKVVCGPGNYIYVGATSSVTISNGYILFNGDSLQLDLTPAHSIYAISNGATGNTAFVLEIGI